jgi:hypothetical protein
MVRVANIPVPDTTNQSSIHDTFIQTDPTDGKTYLYGAGGFTTGFIVWDISNPYLPTEVARWDLTPQCVNDWYSHTIDVTTVKGRRIVTMPTENFSFGAQTDASEECGSEQGNGDKPSAFWFVDATDFTKLGTANDDAATMAKKSADALITTWTNPAGRAGENLTFSAHNQQIVGDKILLTNYHGGLFWLDAAGAFAGRHERPREMAWSVPYEPEQRPTLDYGAWVFTTGTFWDAEWYKGYIFGADIAGGVYSLKVDEGDSSTSPSCTDQLSPATRFTAKLTRKGLIVHGTATERGCNGKVERVLVALAQNVKKKKCRFATAKGKLGKARACSKARFLPATGTDSFALGLRAKLRKGRYTVIVTAVDGAGNVSRASKRLKVR